MVTVIKTPQNSPRTNRKAMVPKKRRKAKRKKREKRRLRRWTCTDKILGMVARPLIRLL